MKHIWNWIRFGKVRTLTADTINGIPCEVYYIGRFNRVVGFWAYGSFDPSFPYQGPKL